MGNIQTCNLEVRPTFPLGASGLEPFIQPALGGGASQQVRATHAIVFPGQTDRAPSLSALLRTRVSPGQLLQLIIDVMIEGLFLLGLD